MAQSRQELATELIQAVGKHDQGFKGNKSYLPSKPCAVCGKEMSWRKSWAKNWDSVKYCSEACRKNSNKK